MAQSTNIKVTIIDTLTNEKFNFNSISAAARFLNIGREIIHNHQSLNNNKLYLGQFYFILDKSIKPINKIQKNNIAIQITDLDTNITTTYKSIRDGAKYMGIQAGSISNYLKLNSSRPLNDRYIIKKILK